MSDKPDPLLAALAAVERDEAPDASRPWIDLLAGRSSQTPESSEEIPADEHAALAALFTAKIPDAEVDALVARVSAGQEPAAVVPLRRRRRIWTALATGLAAAAALVLWVQLDAGPEAVAYSVAVRSASVQPERASGDPDSRHRYRPGSTIDLVISPERAVQGPTVLRVLARGPGGRVLLLAPPTSRTAEGVLIVRGRLGEVLPLEPGPWRLDFLVTAADAAPRDAAEAATAPAAGSLELEVLPSP